MNRKKILISGGAGFIGSNYAHYVARIHPEYEITVLDKLTYAGNLDNLLRIGNSEVFALNEGGKELSSLSLVKSLKKPALIDGKHNLPALRLEAQAEFYRIDLCNYDALDALFEQKGSFDYVINFAGESHVDRSIANPDPFIQANIIGTYNLLKVSRKHGVGRYHQVSTDEVYGDLGEGSTNFFTEETPIDPGCPYANTKASADLIVQSFFRTYGFPATISRCSNNYGPYQFPEKVIPLFLLSALQGNKITLHGEGKHIRDWLFVLDHCRALDLILHDDRLGEIYNIGGNFEREIGEIARLILEELGMDFKSNITSIPDREANDMRYAIDASKLKKNLGWEPSVNFTEGFRYTLNWYKQNQDWLFRIFTREKGELEREKMRLISEGLEQKARTNAIENFAEKFDL